MGAFAISVVVPTRNRPTQIVGCAEALLATAGYQELIVIDQSDGYETQTAMSKFADPRLRYIRTDTRGVTLARNLGIELSLSEIVGFTDDDCRVTTDWASNIATIFSADPEAAVVCGRVRVPEGLHQSGYTATF